MVDDVKKEETAGEVKVEETKVEAGGKEAEGKVEEKPEENQDDEIGMTEDEISSEVEALIRGFSTTQKKPEQKVAAQSGGMTYEQKMDKAKELTEAGDVFGGNRLMMEAIVDKREQAIMGKLEIDNTVSTAQRDREDANRNVYTKHPELIAVARGVKKVAEVPFAKVIEGVYIKHPELADMKNPRGPEIAMAIAEKIMNEKDKGKPANTDESRNKRGAAASVITSSSTNAEEVGAGEELTANELAVANKMGITSEEMKKYRSNNPILGKEFYTRSRSLPKAKAKQGAV